MLDVSRIEQGRIVLKPVRMDTTPLLNELLSTWRPTATHKSLVLSGEIAGGIFITIDPDKFRQVATNLVSNAVKYTQKGTISVKTYVEKGRFILLVSDTGVGMTNEEREQLF